MAETEVKLPSIPRIPKIDENTDGWGPVSVPEGFRSLPYQTFNKADRIGKIADWIGQDKPYENRRYGRYNQQQSYSSGQIGTQYAYYHDEDDSTFQLVDTSRPQRTMMQRGIRIRQQQLLKKQAQRERERKVQAGYASAQRGRGGYGARGGNTRGGQRGRFNNRFDQQRNQRNRGAPSVAVKPDWEVLEDMDFPRLSKLNFPHVGAGEDIDSHRYGTLYYYDKNFDRITTKSERPLQLCAGVYYNVTTTDDPVIQQLARENTGNVFATDILISAIMAAPRSFYSWDIVAERVGNKLFFDKRPSAGWVTSPDALTVSETHQEPPSDEAGINSPKSLAQEAVYVNQNFRQQVLRRATDEKHSFDHPAVPFDDGENEQQTTVAYKYRKFDLGTSPSGDPITLVVRTEHDGVVTGANGETQYLTLKAFNEFDSVRSGVDNRGTGYIDWRSKLDAQKGAVTATELKNNSFKLAKWNIQAVLAGSDIIKFGFVSRASMRDSSKHVILGTQQYTPHEFAANITLDLNNCWGILRCIIDLCMKQPVGKYLLMKEAGKNVIRLYKLPAGTFDSEESDIDEEEDENDSADDGDDEGGEK